MSNRNLVIIGVSTGGPMTLKELFRELPPLNASFVVVLHITAAMDFRIAEGLNAVCSMPVALAREGEYLKTGHVYLAPGGVHLKLEGNQRVSLFDGPRVNFVLPSVDVTLHSLQPSEANLIGVILTGMGKDGAEGIRYLKEIGGITIAQDQRSSTIYGMPRAAAETGAVDYVLPPKKIAELLTDLLGPLHTDEPAEPIEAQG
ncbi:CheB methylesterase domain-containing protein [Geomesophilobacter sediminis]|uniref:protein-glutamate methylesterase n=1 Tax=Geomesophilobacter sediminis TaxID=2798584 RepID=A0A8J7M286_9BACT|nr:CheB methylesterase domain-containing protein [Geomesophilobacter sediminis]MBJ6727243.1 chemotaxis protein CheB [Geomesophilobacter sediminis]